MTAADATGTAGSGCAGLVLTPGAGADRDHSALRRIDGTVSELGVVVDRVDFPYRVAGRRAPDRPPILIATIRGAAESLAARLDVAQRRIALGGRSLGGRMSSMAVAEGFEAAGLVLVSYPLHPPGKPEQLRTSHFPDIGVPCLFVSGTRDAFAAPDELLAATPSINAAVTHIWIEGGDHGLRRHDETVAASVGDWIRGTLCP